MRRADVEVGSVTEGGCEGGADHGSEERALFRELDVGMSTLHPHPRVGQPVGRCPQHRRCTRSRSARLPRRTTLRRRDRQGSAPRPPGARAATRPRAPDRARRAPTAGGRDLPRARDGAEHVDVDVDGAAVRVIEIAALRYHAPRGLEAVDATAVRRDAYRPADVGAHLEAGEPRSHRGRGPARGSAGGAVERPRVVGDAEQLIEGLEVARPLREVRLPEHDRARCLEPRDSRRVLGGHIVGKLLRTTG